METEDEDLFFRESGPFSITIVEDDDIATPLPKDPLVEAQNAYYNEFWSDSVWG